jgi:hypothetical protein
LPRTCAAVGGGAASEIRFALRQTVFLVAGKATDKLEFDEVI